MQDGLITFYSLCDFILLVNPQYMSAAYYTNIICCVYIYKTNIIQWKSTGTEKWKQQNMLRDR